MTPSPIQTEPPEALPTFKVWRGTFGWNYSVPGVSQRDKAYRTQREAQAAAKRALKRKEEAGLRAGPKRPDCEIIRDRSAEQWS